METVKAKKQVKEVKPSTKEVQLKAKKTEKAKVLKEVKVKEKVSLLEPVISKREVKYIYPKDVVDTLSRKKWRQEVRNKLKKYERDLYKLQQDGNKVDLEKKEKEYLKFKETVVKSA